MYFFIIVEYIFEDLYIGLFRKNYCNGLIVLVINDIWVGFSEVLVVGILIELILNLLGGVFWGLSL